MDLIFTFILTLFLISAVTWGLTGGLRYLDRRVAQWPLFWATALWLCVVVPVLGLLMSRLPNSVTPDVFGGFSLHEPFESLGLTVLTSADPADPAGFLSLAEFKLSLIALYGGGVLLSLFKLAWGRHRIRRIIKKAGTADIAGQEDVLVSGEVDSPLAWTPFGRPSQSRILLPQSYRGVVSAAQIQDIIMHERAHISRRDDEIGLILRGLLCLCWISPLVKSLFAAWSQATEIRCDMAVTANRAPKMRKAYADTLLQSLHIVAGRVRQYPAASFSTQRIRNEKMRIKHIMDGTEPAFKRGRDKAWLGAIAVSFALTGAMAISSAANAGPADKTKQANYVTSPMVSGRLTSKYGITKDPFNAEKTRNHYGIDIAAPAGTPIYAPAIALVREVTDSYKDNPNYGRVVVLETKGNVLTVFTHLDGYNVEAGQKVAKGTQIATVGSTGKSTGPHVHIETYKDGKRVDPQSIWKLAAK